MTRLPRAGLDVDDIEPLPPLVPLSPPPADDPPEDGFEILAEFEANSATWASGRFGSFNVRFNVPPEYVEEVVRSSTMPSARLWVRLYCPPAHPLED